MDQQRPQGFWPNMMRQRPAMETNSVRNPTAILIGPPDDPTQMVPPSYPHQPYSMLDEEKTGATLLFSGVVLVVVGVTFTAMGWTYYQTNPRFDWPQLLGPILISVGGTFLFMSAKFSFTFWSCRQRDENMLEGAVMEQTSRGHCFTISGRIQPIMMHDITTMLCTPPAYDFITQEVNQGVDFQPCNSVSGIHAAIPPSHNAVFCVDNAEVTSQEAHSTETDNKRNRVEKTENERGDGANTCCTSSHPPAYEDIYPSFDKHNLS